MTVERRAQTLLVEVVANEANRPPEHEQAVQGTNLRHRTQREHTLCKNTQRRAGWECSAHLDVLVRLVRGERSAVTEEIDEAYSDAAVDVEDELWESTRS